MCHLEFLYHLFYTYVDNDSCKCQHDSAQQTNSISIAIILNFVKRKQRKKIQYAYAKGIFPPFIHPQEINVSNKIRVLHLHLSLKIMILKIEGLAL
jgi:hypothetical protein